MQLRDADGQLVRKELASDVGEAVAYTSATAGRTIAFSALTAAVAISRPKTHI